MQRAPGAFFGDWLEKVRTALRWSLAAMKEQRSLLHSDRETQEKSNRGETAHRPIRGFRYNNRCGFTDFRGCLRHFASCPAISNAGQDRGQGGMKYCRREALW